MASKIQVPIKNNFGTTNIIQENIKKNLSVEVPIKKYAGDGFMTAVIYDNKGERIFVADKDSRLITSICLKNYEILGFFKGHQGAIWSLGVSINDKILISGGADKTLRFYNSLDGTEIFFFNNDSLPGYPKQIVVSKNNILAVLYESLTGKTKSYIGYYDLSTLSSEGIEQISMIEFEPEKKPSVIKWFDESKVILGFNEGSIIIKDYLDDLIEQKSFKFHTDSIKSLTMNNNKNIILTGSQDGFCKLIQINNDNQFEVIREFNLISPVASAIFNYNERKIIVTGSIDAVNVAFSKNNDFNIKFFGIKENKLINEMSTHFGPVRGLINYPGSKNLISIGQDGFLKIYLMDLVIEPTSNKPTSNVQEQTINVDEKKINPPTFGVNLDDNSRKLSEEIKQLVYVNIKISVPIISSGSNVFIPDQKFQDLAMDVPLEKNKTTIKVSGLPKSIDPDIVRELFELHGVIEERGGVKVIDTRDDTFAFVKYIYEESASRAIQMKNGFTYGYQILHVELARSR